MPFKLFIVSKKRIPDTEWVLYLALAISCAAFALAIWVMLTSGPWHMHQFGTGAFKDVTGGVQSLITGAGIAVGGYWAYFKFVRGRTFVARLSIELDGQWGATDGMTILHVRVRVKNIGGSKVALNQFGSGLEVGFPAGDSYHQVTWEKVKLEIGSEPFNARQFSVLVEHEWIEPGETVSDELLLHLEGVRRRSCVLELKLMAALSQKHLGEYCDSDTENFARRILAPDDRLLDRVK
jgi:hypothetical protein